LASVSISVVGGGQPTVGKQLQIDVTTDVPIPSAKVAWYDWMYDWLYADDDPLPHTSIGLSDPLPWNPYALASPRRLTITQDMVGHAIVATVKLYYLWQGPSSGSELYCGTATSPEVIPMAASPSDPVTPVAPISISKVSVGYMKTLAYNGYQQYPYSATFRYGGKFLSPDDFTIKLGTNRKVGKGTFTITGKGRFTGSKTYSFKIKKMSLSQRSAAAKAEAKRLAKLIKLHATSKRDRAIIIYTVASVAGQNFQSNAWYKKNFGNEAYSDFAMGESACSGSTSASILLAQALGIKTKHVNANKWTHQWAMFKVTSTQWWKVDTWTTLNTHGYWPKWFSNDTALKQRYLTDANFLLHFPMNLVYPSNWKKRTPFM